METECDKIGKNSKYIIDIKHMFKKYENWRCIYQHIDQQWMKC